MTWSNLMSWVNVKGVNYLPATHCIMLKQLSLPPLIKATTLILNLQEINNGRDTKCNLKINNLEYNN